MADLEIPRPNKYQMVWHEMEFYGFIHFSLNTFTDKEWGYGDEPASLFNPTELNARQWAEVASKAGMKALILTCKHHDGFCLWPSAYTEHSVKNSPWKDGKGDLVREVSEACREFNLKFGVYLSPWDRNHADYGRPEYIVYYRNQLRELLTNYGDVFEVWLDGANGGDGYYGGANENRRIDASSYYDWPGTIEIIRELQPKAVVFSDAGPDIRWVGTEKGFASETTWYTLDVKGRYPGYTYPGYNAFADLGMGHRNGNSWLPPEVDVSIRPGWFYHANEDERVKTPAELLDMYYRSVGYGANLLLNLPPSRRGLLHERDVENILTFSKLRDVVFNDNLAANANIVVTEDGLIVEFPTLLEINHIILREDISRGQRITQWQLEVIAGGQWQKLQSGSSVGHKRIVRFDNVKTNSIRIMTDCDCAISGIEAYDSYVCISNPTILRDENGFVSIDADKAVVRYTFDGSEPCEQSELFTQPFELIAGGTVKAAILQEDNLDLVMMGVKPQAMKTFGLCKKNWRIASCSGQLENYPADNILDNYSQTFWLAESSEFNPAEICVDLGKTENIQAVGYLPRQDGNTDGIVTRYAVYLSNRAQDCGYLVADGCFDNVVNNSMEQLIELTKPTDARFLRFVAVTTAASCTACVTSLDVYVQ